MTSVLEELQDQSIVAGRVFARTAPDGTIDGLGERGIYADDMRLLRRVEAYRPDREAPVPGLVAVGADGCALRFVLAGVEPGAGVLLVVEVDGTDLFTAREVLLDAGDAEAGAPLGAGLGDARPDARLRLEVACEGASLLASDGFALAGDGPVSADGTPRTASWQWRVAQDATAPVDVTIDVRVAWALSSDAQPPDTVPIERLREAHRRSRQDWLAARPLLGGVDLVAEVGRASLEDLAQLRIDTEDGIVLAAGVPWFLTVFGRDALLAAWMALPVDPTLAGATLRYLARVQAARYDLATDAEPGKILHEERRGVAARRWHERYYGSVDATPLFVMLLAETCRWTGDLTLARELEQPARRAIAWVQSRIDEDELGLLSYWRRAERGLEVQSWKDSPDSQRDHAGRIATGLVRPIEAQGYAVAALRAAARLATSAWEDEVLASEWAASARLLESRIAERYFVELPGSQLRGAEDPRHGGFLAQAVDAAGLPLDALCSNPGHLLWSESIADPSLRTRVVEQLTSGALDTGWGIRTMSSLDAGFDPASYHCGSVWPHDTALCIAGIARYDRESAGRLGRHLVEAAGGAGGRLPELFAGTARAGDATRPEALSVACSPQAWAAASPFLVLRALLGLEPDANGRDLVASTGEAPEWLAGLRWRGVHALGARWDVEVAADATVDVVHVSG